MRQCLGRYATGVAVVTTQAPGGPLGITANSFASVSLDPPLVLWSPAKRSARFAAFRAAQDYAIHVLTAEQEPLARRFARAGHGFEGLDWRAGPGGVPLLEGVLARFLCRQEAVHDGGDHAIIVGRVLEAVQREGAPLVFLGGRYGGFAPFA
nr:flavin reductase family protein [Actibacterium sp. MT2.3-13A]